MSNHPLNYQQLKQAVAQKHFDLIVRTPEMVAKYEADKAKILQDWPSLQEYCHKEVLLKQKAILRKNDYPYFLAPDCLHYTFWTTENLSLSAAKKYIQEKLFVFEEFVIWESPQPKQSIKIKHFQVVFYKPETK